jgi:protein SCO1
MFYICKPSEKMNYKNKHLVVNHIEIFIRTLLVFLVVGIYSLPAMADDIPPELGIFEQLDNYLPDDLTFTDENANTVKLIDLIDKPTVIALVYYNCPGICSPLLEGVADVISKATMSLGSEYQVFTISFDHTEKPQLARDKKSNFAKLVKNQDHDVENGWKWFTGDSTNIALLLNSLGYKIKKTGVDYIHPGALVVVSPNAKITRYLHGVYYLPFDLKMAVIEASEERSGPTINKVLRYCFSYDPDGKKYVLNVTKISGTFIIFLAVLLLGGMMVSEYRRRKNRNIRKADK